MGSRIGTLVSFWYITYIISSIGHVCSLVVIIVWRSSKISRKKVKDVKEEWSDTLIEEAALFLCIMAKS